MCEELLFRFRFFEDLGSIMYVMGMIFHFVLVRTRAARTKSGEKLDEIFVMSKKNEGKKSNTSINCEYLQLIYKNRTFKVSLFRTRIG